MTFSVLCNQDLFEMWLEECLLLQLQLGDVVLSNNASFHYSQSIEDVLAAGCKFWYLPPLLADSSMVTCNTNDHTGG